MNHYGLQTCNLCDLCGDKYGQLGQPPEWRRPRQKVPGFLYGTTPVDIMFVCEAPGEVEDKIGRPFQGAAGQVLHSAIFEAGLDALHLYITNVNKCRPPGNRAPAVPEIAACNVWLQMEIDLMRPKVVVALGKTAMSAFMVNYKFKGKVGDKVGKVIATQLQVDAPALYGVVGCYHPAARDAKQRAMIPVVLEEVGKLFGIAPKPRAQVDYQLEVL